MKQLNLPVFIITLAVLTACGEEQKKTVEQPVTSSQTEAIEPDESSGQSTSNEPTGIRSDDKANGIDAPLEFSLTNLDGELVNAAEFRGKWLVLNYWATWCGPCRDEMPELVKFQNEHDNVQILGIAYEDAEIHKLKSFAADFNVNYPLLTIDIYNPPKFAEEGGLGLPTTIVYNPEGLRHKKHMGPIDAAGLAEMLEEMERKKKKEKKHKKEKKI